MSEIWRPSPARTADANLTRFIARIAQRNDLPARDYDSLYAWSISHPAEFWEELAAFAQIRADWGSGPSIEHPDRMPGARFFPTARLNYAEHLLHDRDQQAALIFRNEHGTDSRREMANPAALEHFRNLDELAS
jgi:acetoacetyl-CoA synthetase